MPLLLLQWVYYNVTSPCPSWTETRSNNFLMNLNLSFWALISWVNKNLIVVLLYEVGCAPHLTMSKLNWDIDYYYCYESVIIKYYTAILLLQNKLLTHTYGCTCFSGSWGHIVGYVLSHAFAITININSLSQIPTMRSVWYT